MPTHPFFFSIPALQILCECVPLLGLDLNRSFSVPLLERLSEDPVFRVRKVCATCCGPLCEAISPDPDFERVVWSVGRASGAGILVHVGVSAPYPVVAACGIIEHLELHG